MILLSRVYVLEAGTADADGDEDDEQETDTGADRRADENWRVVLVTVAVAVVLTLSHCQHTTSSVIRSHAFFGLQMSHFLIAHNL